MKQCTLCKETKPFSDFNENARYKDGYYKHCKRCHYDTYGRKAHLKRTYGLTEEDYNTLLSKQQYKCFSCGVSHGAFKNDRLFIDHCHKTGKIRGLLCHGCNIALGSVKDNIETLKNLIKYLEQHDNT